MVLNVILPPRCPLTGAIVDENGALSAEAWEKLTFIRPPACRQCGYPFSLSLEDQTQGDGAFCGPCLKSPPAYDRARASLLYDEASRDLILAFKHGDRTDFVPCLNKMLMRAAADLLGEELTEQSWLCAPVPLHPLRLLKRRYNQSALLAAALSRTLRYDYGPDLLKRTRHTPPQGHLSSKDRYKNVRTAFAVTQKYASCVRGRNILLVDDVFTSGATIEACARTLKKAGAAQIYAVTVARVPNPRRDI